MQNDSFDYESFKQEALKELYAGKPLMGENGIFTPLLKHFLEATLQGELDTHLREEQAKSNSNRRNGSGKKQVRSSMGKFDLETPRDRAGSYEPIIVPKRQTVLTDQLESKIISMYGRGMSYSDISGHLQELYGFSLSAGELSSITAEYCLFWKSGKIALYTVFMWLFG